MVQYNQFIKSEGWYDKKLFKQKYLFLIWDNQNHEKYFLKTSIIINTIFLNIPHLHIVFVI